MAGFAYPYNPEAKNDACVVTNETHNLFDTTNRWRCIIPLWAPFFHGSQVIEHLDKDGVTHELREGLDYYLGHYSEEVNKLTRQRVYGSIMLIQPLEGSVRFKTYETVGGAFNIRRKDALDYLAKNPLPDPRNEDWGAVMKYVRPVDPSDRPVNLPDAIKKDVVTKALSELVNKLNELSTTESQQYTAIFNRIRALTDRTRAFRLLDHQHDIDAHDTTYQQLGALGKDEVANNTLLAYGRTVAEIIALIKSMGIVKENVDKYYELIGGTFQGRISFQDGATCLIQNIGGTAVIDFNAGHIKLLADKSVTLHADTDRNDPGVGVVSAAGNNALSVHSSGVGKDKYKSRFNGYYLIHVGNIDDYLAEVGQSTSAVFDIHTANTATANLSGKGTIQDPLRGFVTYPNATEIAPGMVKLAMSLTSATDGMVASANALYALVEKLNDYVPSSRKVQNKPLTGDLTFNRNDIGLNRVDNTSVSEKPVSNPFTAAVAGKADIGHKHDLNGSDLLPPASPTTRGIVQLTSTYVETDVEKAVTQKLATYYYDAVEAQRSLGDTKLKSQYVHVIEYGTRAPKPLVSLSGNTVTVREDVRYFVDSMSEILSGWSADLSVAYPPALNGAEAHIYVDLSKGDEAYTVGPKKEDTETGSWLGYVKLKPVPEVVVSPFVRLLNVVELVEHINSHSAHNFDTNIRRLLGLDKVENKPIVDAVNLPTFQQVFDNWYRISHGNSDRYPFSPDELQTWTYDAATGSIRNTTNSVTFIGMVSLATVGDYEFEVGLSSTNADDDSIGIVLAFYKDPITSKEHTLSLLRHLGSQNTGDDDINYTYNMQQRDAYVIRKAGNRKQIGWNAAGETIVSAKRVGNLIHCKVREFSKLNPAQPVVDEYTIDLESDPRLSVFLGEARYGYCAQSQQDSTWRSIKWPEGDGRGYYASMKALRDIKEQCLDKAIILSGVIAHGATVPLPPGFTREQVNVIVIPETFNGHASGIKEYHCSVNAAGVVTHSAVAGDGTALTGTVKYYLVGVK